MDFQTENHESNPITRKIHKNQLKNHKKKFTSISTKSNSQENIEDRRLKNWKKWLRNREKTCHRLKSLTGRRSEDLLLNSYEKIRPKIAIQNLLEVATVEILSEKSQNDLNFWATPEFLRNRKCPDIPEIAVSVNKKLLKLPPDVSRVFLPEISQREKCLTVPASFPLTEKRNDYLLRKLELLSGQIAKLNLNVREIDQVAVVGVRIPEKEKVVLIIEGEEIIFEKNEEKHHKNNSEGIDFVKNSIKNEKNQKNNDKEIIFEKNRLENQNDQKNEIMNNEEVIFKKNSLKNQHNEKINNKNEYTDKNPSETHINEKNQKMIDKKIDFTKNSAKFQKFQNVQKNKQINDNEIIFSKNSLQNESNKKINDEEIISIENSSKNQNDVKKLKSLKIQNNNSNKKINVKKMIFNKNSLTNEKSSDEKVISIKNPLKSQNNENNPINHQKPDSNPLIYSLNFFSPQNNIQKQSICLLNQTFSKITYEWQEILPDAQELEKVSVIHPFHFEKASGLIYPGQCEDLSIIYHPSTPGASMESIRLDTDPSIAEVPIIFRLWGVCDEPSGLDDKLLSYEDYVHVRHRNSIISEIIEAIWSRIESAPPETPCYADYFLESDVFEAKNPNYHYHHEIINELKALYVKILKKDPWALNLSELRAHLFKPDDVTKFIELTQKLQKPRKQKLVRNSKHDTVYNLLSSFVVALSDLSESTKSQLTLEKWLHLKLEWIQDDVSRYSLECSGSLETLEERTMRDKELFYGDFRGQDGYDEELYCEIFYARIYELLGDTVDQISAAIQGIDLLAGEEGF